MTILCLSAIALGALVGCVGTAWGMALAAGAMFVIGLLVDILALGAHPLEALLMSFVLSCLVEVAFVLVAIAMVELADASVDIGMKFPRALRPRRKS